MNDASAASAAARPRDPYGRGQPTKFTPDTQAAFLTALRAGHKRKAACAIAGISYQTFLNWQTEANQHVRSDYGDFFDAVHTAEQEGRAAIAQRVIDATERDWRAGVKWLAIVDPEEYSEQRQLRITHEGTVTHAHVHTLAMPDPEQLAQLVGLLGAPALPALLEGQAADVTDPE